MRHLTALLAIATVALVLGPSPAAAQLSLQWMVPAAADTPGLNGTRWHTDLSLHNPHDFDLPVVIQFLPSNADNQVADTLTVTLYPWETFNLWDVLGPNHFDTGGTGALLVFADISLACDPVEDCEFLATSRTYTIDPSGSGGEFGQTIPGSGTWQGVDWDTLGYAAGVLNDGVAFRCNVGIASWSGEWTSVVVDVQDAAGSIIASESVQVPPFGHVQSRLATAVEGGSLVFWIEEGSDDPLVFGYASVVDQTTGDSSFQLAQPSSVGFKAGATATRRPGPASGGGDRVREVTRVGAGPPVR
ncbi:MAG: hypothetical protein V2I67_04550 [Thermoanaerobaculales bacterium]|jgi:hypothetical protein|nr:hypothetical protein [Thermoanaerobaculales bacterium]